MNEEKEKEIASGGRKKIRERKRGYMERRVKFGEIERKKYRRKLRYSRNEREEEIGKGKRKEGKKTLEE